jgi:hypothetical protein
LEGLEAIASAQSSFLENPGQLEQLGADLQTVKNRKQPPAPVKSSVSPMVSTGKP